MTLTFLLVGAAWVAAVALLLWLLSRLDAHRTRIDEHAQVDVEFGRMAEALQHDIHWDDETGNS